MFRYLDAGGYHACGITTTEQLLCWGYNADGQAGARHDVAGHQSRRLIPGRLSLSSHRRRLLPRLRHHPRRRGLVLGQQRGRATRGRRRRDPIATSPVAGDHGAERRHAAGRHRRRGSACGSWRSRSLPGRPTPAASTSSQTSVVLGAQSRRSARPGRLRRPPSRRRRVSTGAAIKEVSVGGLHTCAITVGWRRPVLGLQPGRPAGRRERPPTNPPMPVAVCRRHSSAPIRS